MRGVASQPRRRFEAFAAPYELATVRATLAEILTATGDLAGAQVLSTSAAEVAERLGAQPLLRRLGQAPVPASASPGAPRTSLTPRESEILALVAEGRTNGEIGRQLFISTKTVSVHVSNILGKLGPPAAPRRPPSPAATACWAELIDDLRPLRAATPRGELRETVTVCGIPVSRPLPEGHNDRSWVGGHVFARSGWISGRSGNTGTFACS